MSTPFTIKWSIPIEKEGMEVKQFLKEQQISKTALTDIKFKGGEILVNNIHVTVKHILKDGENLKVIFPEERVSPGLHAEKINLNIVYEDNYFLIINKAPYMSTIPSREHPTGSLSNALMGYYEKINLRASPHIITRLDRNTSGLVLIAKHRHIHHLMSIEQKRGRIERIYEALVEGKVLETSGTIELPIDRKPGSIIERAVSHTGQFARTHYKVKQQYEDFAQLQINLETGRTHQIRVHFSHIGHPLLGDDLYGGKINKITRQALHCKEINFVHPISKETLSFTTELFTDMSALLRN